MHLLLAEFVTHHVFSINPLEFVTHILRTIIGF